MSNRSITTGFPWTTAVTPNVPSIPSDGSTYRNSAITQTLLAAGWPFNVAVASSTINEMLYRLTVLMLLIEGNGIMPWSTLTGYLPGAVVMGSNGLIYTGISGTTETPNQGNDPATDNGSNWFEGINWTPVQQGGGVDQTTDKLNMGWDSTGTNHVRVSKGGYDEGELAWVTDEARYAVDTGTANVYIGVFAPPVTSLYDGLVVTLKIAHSNTGSSTLTANSEPTKSILGLAGTPLQGGELPTNGDAVFKYNSSVASGAGAWILLDCEGGPLQVADAIASKHAINQESGDARYAALAGNPSQTFQVNDPIHPKQALNLETGDSRYLMTLFSTVYDVANQRAFNVQYTNNTGKPMFVAASGESDLANPDTITPPSNLYLKVNGIIGFIFGQSIGGSQTSTCGIVPAGATYSIVYANGIVTMTNWTETW